MKKVFSCVCLLALCLLFASSSWGQAQITTGTVQGDVTDERGGAVPGATVEAKNLDTNFVRTETTDNDGHFTFLNLAPGRYTLTISKSGFSTIVQQNVNLTVGQAISIPVTVKVSSVATQIIVTDVPTIETTKTESSSTLEESTIANTPVLGRKFEDLLTLTPGVAITQGPDGDEINFNGQRGVFNNISLDGGDYNNGFFGEQLGGQRAAIDITLDAVKEFQVIASGANAEFGRTAGGVINVITKSGTNQIHGSAFEYFRTEALTADTSDGKPLKDFNRNQFGGTLGGPIVKDKMFFFGAIEHIRSNLTRPNLSETLGSTPCSVTNPVFNSNITDAQIEANPDCQRLTLLDFMNTSVGQNEGLPIKHPIRNTAVLGRFDWNLNKNNQLAVSYNFDYSKNENQTFDVPTYGTSANGTEGPSKINVVNMNYFTTFSSNKLNEAHFSYQREVRPRSATQSKIPADTAMGFGTTFRFGNPFFLEPNVDETIWRTQLRDSFSLIHGKHNFKFGGDWLHTNNSQTFRGFFTGRYIFDSVSGFLHYASPDAAGGFGPTVGECLNNTTGAFTGWITQDRGETCAANSSVGGPLIFYLQDGVPTGLVNIPPGASSINNEDYALFAQDKWQILPNLSLSYGLRWEAQIFPGVITPPSQTAYGEFLSNPLFPSDGTLHSAKKEFQPRVGFAWDVLNNHKSVLRGSYGIYYGHQNMLSQVGSITTNGVQQSTIFTISGFGGGPAWPGDFTPTPGVSSCGTNPFPCFTGVRVFSKNYENPKIYTTNVAYEQEIIPNLSAYVDFTLSKGVHLTSFDNVNVGGLFDAHGTEVIPPAVNGVGFFGPDLGDVFVTYSTAKSLYRGLTIGMKKRFSQRFQLEWNYVLSEDLDNDSNERDPFTDRRLNPANPSLDYSFSDRDERHKFNLFGYVELPGGFNFDGRLQAHTPQPITPSNCVSNLDCKRNSTWKDNEYISFDWRATRPFKLGDRFTIIPAVEMFNTFNNKNNVNPLATPALFNFDGFLRLGVGDPRQAQLSVRFQF
ncbi:MAG TPA: TonB-dependent receptor [Candidatus Sulfotelmatobacter sp.]|jgi:outer membrane receptor protein involved in Fe transport|nr:TonB-dependent receptor [Candidatus Sulfotelmatobacter sp.]